MVSLLCRGRINIYQDWPQSLHYLAFPNHFYRRNAERYGSEFVARFTIGEPFVVTTDSDVIRELVVGDPDFFEAGSSRNILRPLLGRHSLLLLDGTEHRRQRKLMMPPLHGERMRSYGDAMSRIVNTAIDGLPLLRPVRMANVAQAITFDVIMETVFGASADQHPVLARTIQDILVYLENPFVLSAIDIEGNIHKRVWDTWLGEYSQIEKFLRCKAQLTELLRELYDQRLAGTNMGSDLFSMLLDARDEDGNAMTFEEIHDELVTMLLAGHETTSTALCNTLIWLSKKPEILAKVREEVAELGGGNALDPDQVRGAKYTMALIKEVLRHNPVVPIISRRVKQDWTFGGKTYPAGTDISPSIYLVHHNPQVWEEPQSFRPERFLERSYKPWEYMPFGFGNRTCIGMAFAYYELSIFVTEFVRRMNFNILPGYKPTTKAKMIVTAPTAGVPMSFWPR